nr:hypothetical protein [Tanacetum cinerariifolium]
MKVDWNGVTCIKLLIHGDITIWNMTSNGEQTRVPESYVHQSYCLTAWQSMYMFKVNPLDGPDLWPKSNILGILTPQPSRPRKKKKESAYELADGKGKKINQGRNTNVESQPTSQTTKKLAKKPSKKPARGSQTQTGSLVASGSQPASSSHHTQTTTTGMGSPNRMTKASTKWPTPTKPT